MASVPPAPLYTRAFIALTATELLYFTAVGMALFALPLFVTGPVAGDEAGAGIAVGAFAVSALVLRPFAGRLSDRIGRRPLILGGALIAAASLGLLLVADDLVVVVLLRLLAGVAEAAFFVSIFAALADIAPPERMGEALSINSLRLYLGLAFGPPLAEALIGAGGYAAVWIGATGLALVAAALGLVVGETSSERTPPGAPLRILHRPALPISLGFLTALIAMGGYLAFASLHALDVGIGNASVALLTFGVVVVVCRIAFARVPDRLPSLPLGAAALGAIATGLVIAALWRDVGGLVVGAIVLGVGVAFSTPAFFSAVFATASPAERGLASGTASAAIDLGLGIGPILLGFVAASSGIPWAFAVGALVALAGAAWTLGLARRAQSTPPA
ncbi:permease [Agromyces rhizosphaerae]|uniref:Permease n=1 Tax=Agromyces rhizosphaerae TaxID=88374 RepID=A0A9W6CZN3_9MICO|nr:MFS transporter [Agromyces rhizosphaerae]GLI28911.1 permease [Agromyces rhizosphaerae]